MKKDGKSVFSGIILCFSLLIFSNCASTTEDYISISPHKTLKSVSLDTITMKIPDDSESQSYLGLSGENSFKITQIRADVILINVFSTTCPHCQKEAPNTNKLFKAIVDRPDLKERIKIIGIGTKNTAEEIQIFKKEYNVPSDVILKEHDERSWRDSELIRTDELVKLPDFPQDLLAYRQLLREYPQSNNFPNGVRPIINNIKVR